jgi:hypothetical protein
VLRRLNPVFASVLAAFGLVLLASCGPNIQTKEKVREDMLAHLQKAGLQTNAMDIDVTQVTFDKNRAHATVSFRMKGASNIHDGMTMNYTLESRDGHWVVIGRADSQGHGSSVPRADLNGRLPPDHPPLGALSAPKGMGVAPSGMGAPSDIKPLPPGHPAVGDPGAPTPSDVKPLPPGHPNASALHRPVSTRLAYARGSEQLEPGAVDGVRFVPGTGNEIGTGIAA